MCMHVRLHTHYLHVGIVPRVVTLEPQICRGKAPRAEQEDWSPGPGGPAEPRQEAEVCSNPLFGWPFGQILKRVYGMLVALFGLQPSLVESCLHPAILAVFRRIVNVTSPDLAAVLAEWDPCKARPVASKSLHG